VEALLRCDALGGRSRQGNACAVANAGAQSQISAEVVFALLAYRGFPRLASPADEQRLQIPKLFTPLLPDP
jgi:hypothetical protein